MGVLKRWLESLAVLLYFLVGSLLTGSVSREGGCRVSSCWASVTHTRHCGVVWGSTHLMWCGCVIGWVTCAGTQLTYCGYVIGWVACASTDLTWLGYLIGWVPLQLLSKDAFRGACRDSERWGNTSKER